MSDQIEKERQAAHLNQDVDQMDQTPMTESRLKQVVPAKIFKDRHIMQTEQLRKEHFNVGQRYRLSKKKGVKINEDDEFFIINEQK